LEAETADAVIHAGDYGSGTFFNEFVSKCRLFYGVLGNNDRFDLPRELTVELDGVKIAVTHSDMVFGERESYLLKRFRGAAPDLIVYGHTHRAMKHPSTKPLIINPGSPTRGREAFNAFAVLETNGGRLNIDFKKIDKG
jgi:putative phosphoesterase